MTIQSVIKQLRSGQNKTAADSNEASWYKSWSSFISADLTPTLIALTGGYNCLTPADVFITGYQAAVRAVFPETPGNGWAAFVASEDQTDPERHPPTRLTTDSKDWRLNGTKSWVAQSRHVDYLLVTALTDTGESVTVLVNRHQPGINITHRDNPSFLPAMSQGFATFDNVLVNSSQLLNTDRRMQFVKSESKFVMLAAAAWMFGQTPKSEHTLSTEFEKLVEGLSLCCDNPDHNVTELAALDNKIQELLPLFEQFPAAQQNENWKSDKKIFTIYSKGIQAAAAKKMHDKQIV